MNAMLRHVQTLEGRILVTADEYRRLREQQKRFAPRVLTDEKGRVLGASRLHRPAAMTPPPKPPRFRTPGQRMALLHIELPKPPFRWVASRKALVVAAIRSGQITFGDACRRFDVAAPEMFEWMARATEGEHALRVTKRPGGLA